jgi:hypothetical protein
LRPTPQSNGTAESFVKTVKHNYVAYMDKPDAPTALSRLAIAFEHYNERQPNRTEEHERHPIQQSGRIGEGGYQRRPV